MQVAFTGDTVLDLKTREAYATDKSAFRVMPSAIYYPRTVDDIRFLMNEYSDRKRKGEAVSISVRAGGTCMSGGSLSRGAIVDMTRYMNAITIDPQKQTATVEMGAYFRDIEAEAAKHSLMFPAYPSSRGICGIGGMIGNNASGEKSLRYGATIDNVLALQVVFADGSVRYLLPQDSASIEDARDKELLLIAKEQQAAFKAAAGNVKKTAAGYRIDRVIDADTFNATALFVGAQGTLGIVTKAVLRLSPIPEHHEMLVVSAESLAALPDIVATLLHYHPESLETFDSNTFTRARLHLAEFADSALPYLAPNAHLFMIAEFSEKESALTKAVNERARAALEEKGYFVRTVSGESDRAALWQVRRNSFTLMRDYNPKGYKAVPCIEDVIVPIARLGEFIEAFDAILIRHKIKYGYHGHIGDGSLRIIPVFDFTAGDVAARILALMDDTFALVKRLGGNISADHSDGIIRTPFLPEQYGADLMKVFDRIKTLYDPLGILNPGKKVGGTRAMIEESLDRVV